MAIAGPAVRGTPASAGSASGPIFRVPSPIEAAGHPAAVPAGQALATTARRLDQLAESLPAARAAGADILRAQAAMARDPVLLRSVEERVAGGTDPAVALREEVERQAAKLAALADPYLRERAADVREVGRLAAAELAGVAGDQLCGLDRPSVVIAHEIFPADALGVDPDLLLAIVTETGGRTSHAAIVARELGIPAVVSAAGIMEACADWEAAEVDGSSGEVRRAAGAEVQARRTHHAPLELGALPVRLMANVGSRDGAHTAVLQGAQGIGLFRTEFMFLAVSEPLAEAEQEAVYADACRVMSPHPVVIRTLDAGSDKPLAYLPVESEPNPALGRRGARLWLEREELWRPQVRALARVAADCPNLEVMLPMVAAREEMLAARRRFAAEAKRVGGRVPRLGMMVEVPAVAAALDAFEGVAAFISLGTNDLTQYTVAADRELDWDARLSEFNPGVLSLIALAASSAGRLGMEVAVCGEMAGRPEGALFLAGVGVEALSMTADALTVVAGVLRRIGIERCRAAARDALGKRTAAGALTVLRSALAEP
ncbi:MAG TPA: putative PEP-binding protein [Candidatus Dormibacteraeota bacterium]|nr:putative PEP-binding protein [Candidatus Dormibacteraeota bacterium]